MKRVRFIAIPALALALFGCGVAQWVKAAQQILPVVLPMVTNLVSAISLLQGKTVSAADFRSINDTANQVSADLNLVGQLVDQYQSSPNATTVAKISSALQDVNAHLSQLLTSLHISDPSTAEKVTAIATLINTEVNSIIQILPATSSNRTKVRASTVAPLSAAQLKHRYNAIVSQPTQNAQVDAAFAGAALK